MAARDEEAVAGGVEDLSRRVWWAHRSLKDEAVTTSITAAEAVTLCVADITAAAEARLQSWLAQPTESIVAELRQWQSLVSSEGRHARLTVVEQARTALAWSSLQPWLVSLRKALVRSWYEQRAEEAQQRMDPLHESSGGDGKPATTDHAASSVSGDGKPRLVDALDERSRRQLELLEAQVYDAFLTAVTKAALRVSTEFVSRPDVMNAIRDANASEQDHAKTFSNAILCISLDALLTDMIAISSPSCSSASPASPSLAKRKVAEAAGWTVGFIKQASATEAAVEEENARHALFDAPVMCARHRRLVWYVIRYLRGALQWSSRQPEDAARQVARFPLLVDTARAAAEAAVAAVCARSETLTESQPQQFEKLCASLVHAVVDGTTGYGDTAFSQHSLRLEEGLGVPLDGTRHVLCLFGEEDMTWMRTRLIKPLVVAFTSCPRRNAKPSGTAPHEGTAPSSGGHDTLRAAVVRATFLCHRAPDTIWLTTAFYPWIAQLSTNTISATATSNASSSSPTSTTSLASSSPVLSGAMSEVLQAIDLFWTRSSAFTRGGEAIPITVAQGQSGTHAHDEAEGGGGRGGGSAAAATVVHMNFVYACLARLASILNVMESEVVGNDEDMTIRGTPSPEADHLVEASATTLAACLAAQPILTVNRLLTWLLPRGSDMSRHGSFEAVVSFKGKSSAARAQGFMEVAAADASAVPSTVRVLFPRDASLCDLLEGALAAWQSKLNKRGDERGSAQHATAVEVVAAALTHLVETTWLSRESGQLAIVELLLFAAMVLTQPACETRWRCVRDVLRRFLRLSDDEVEGEGAVTAAVGSARVWRGILRRLHGWVVEQHRYGLLLFFLPTFRALGLDWSSTGTAAAVGGDTPSCLGPRYPSSAELAYLFELPKLFCAGSAGSALGEGGRHIASSMAEDALAWWHDVVFAALENVEDTQTQTASLQSSSATLVIEMLAHAGLVALARTHTFASARWQKLASSSSSTPMPAVHKPVAALLETWAVTPQNAQCVEACSAVFHASMRLCAQVDRWSTAQREMFRERLIKSLARLLAGGDEDVAAVSEVFMTAENAVRHSLAVQRGRTDASADTSAADAHSTTVIAGRLAAMVASVEVEVLDETHLFADIKSLLRGCNLAYMRYIPTRLMLARRAHLEKRAVDMAALRPDMTSAIAEAVRQDVADLLAHEHARLIEEAEKARETDKAERARTAAKAKEEAAMRAAEEAKAHVETAAEVVGENTAEGPLEGDVTVNREAAQVAMSNEAEEKEEKEAAADEEEVEDVPPVVVEAPKQLRLSAAPAYFEVLLSELLARSCASPADARAAALTLCVALEEIGAANLVAPRDLIRFLLRISEALAATLPSATPAEVRALSVLLEVIGVRVVVPYKKSFLAGGKTASSTAADEDCAEDKKRALNLLQSLPTDEKDAVWLTRCYFGDLVKPLTQCLAGRHPRGDVCAAILHEKVRGTVCLVQASRERVEAAVMERVRGLASSATPLTPGLAALRHDMWPSLPADMASPAVTIEHLYTRHPPRARTTTAAVSMAPASSQHTAHVSSGRKRSRSSSEPVDTDAPSTSRRRRLARKKRHVELSETKRGGGDEAGKTQPASPPSSSRAGGGRSGRKRGGKRGSRKKRN